MTEQTCGKGTHRLPEGEESWHSARCDALVAAAFDQCLACQQRLITEVSATLTDDFGRLFTTWVFGAINLRAGVGARMPDTALELFGRDGGALSPPGRKALRGVRLPRQGPSTPYGEAFGLDTKRATEALTAMTPAEREAVLGDALDGIVGTIALT